MPPKPKNAREPESDRLRDENEEQRTTPKLEPIVAQHGKSPESAIGARITHARNQLGLSVEALARYTARFDGEQRGISASTLLRYEAGDPLPGARELRILCETLDVPPLWLLFGRVDNAGQDELEQRLLLALDEYVKRRADEFTVGGTTVRKLMAVDVDKRRRWIAEARSPKSKG